MARGALGRRLLPVVLALVALGTAGCDALRPDPSRATSVTLDATQGAQITFTGGRYRFTWDASECTEYTIQLEPTAGGDPIVVPVTSLTGSVEIDVPAVEASVVRGGNCPTDRHTVTIEKL